MRLSTQQFFQLGSSALSDLNAQTARLQEQISTGKRVLQASDDPGSASRIIRLDSQLANIEQYQTNTDYAESRLARVEQTVSSIENIRDRIYEQVLYAGNGSLTNQQRESITVEIKELTEELFVLVNTRDEQGDYIFSGFNTEQAAYRQNAAGEYFFQGNAGVRRLQVDNDAYVATSESALDVFENIDLLYSQITATESATNSVGFSLDSYEISDRISFDTVFPEDYLVQFQAETDVVPNGPNYSVIRQSDGATIVSNAVYTATGITFEGIQLNTSGAPQPGDELTVNSVERQNMLQIMGDIGNQLTSFDDAQQRQAFIDGSLESLELIQERLLSSRVRVGVNLSNIEQTKNRLADRALAQQDLLSGIEDLDYAKAVSDLSFLTFMLEASQASFSRVSGLSLFNYIR